MYYSTGKETTESGDRNETTKDIWCSWEDVLVS